MVDDLLLVIVLGVIVIALAVDFCAVVGWLRSKLEARRKESRP